MRLSLTLAVLLLSFSAALAQPPNIIVIVADDLGYHDLGVQGSSDIPTPQIDSLAKNGARFTDAYVSSPVCLPSRACLLTGRYPQRFGVETLGGDRTSPEVMIGLPLTEKTLATRLKAAGYSTAAVGKWHLGERDLFHPLNRGFDEFFGFLQGATPYLPGNNTGKEQRLMLRGRTPFQETEYLTDAFGREAVDFIRRHAEKPFFLYLAFNAVHAPVQATEAYLERCKNIADPAHRAYAAMTVALDDNVGRVLQTLRDLKLSDDTLIFFLSDNGGPTSTGASNTPLRGNKYEVYEGGIRTPFLVQWPGHFPGGQVHKQLTSAMDIVPTALAVAGLSDTLPATETDGVNLLPLLTAAANPPARDQLAWRYGPKHSAIRVGNWKLVNNGIGRWELYDLAVDPSETKNLASQQPGKVSELTAAYEKWDATMSPPLWLEKTMTGTKKKRRGEEE